MALQAACGAAFVDTVAAAMRTGPACRRRFDQGQALGRVVDAGDPCAQPGQVGTRQGNSGQQGEQFVEAWPLHRHSR
uniref:Uncharacterized protein n=1 Tax=Tanacetum cinerariifolium TaxID=118510 RepID=A0A699XDF0_TANCI|nr:hypothetical protein [Tanacetum cinerariifolium]